MTSSDVRCPRCDRAAPPDARFCPRCGASLFARCARCGAENAADHTFCAACGAPLDESVGPVRERRSAEAERRQLTVMFCDLVGSAALSSERDPEDTRDIIRAYQDASASVIAAFDGHVAQFLGDGLLVYFGYPEAHEDDARRAVGAGLGIVAAMERVNADVIRDSGVRLEVRVGIHTGLVVIGEVGGADHREHLALGETPNVAARLQALAAPGTVVASDATHALAAAAFEWRSLGAQTLKGIGRPVGTWQAVAERAGSARRSPVDAGRALIGRDAELGLLRQRWEQARRGEGQVVLVTGEAGIGKTRIAEAFAESVRDAAVLRYACSAFHRSSALHPFATQLRDTLHLEGTPASDFAALERWLADTGGDAADAPVLAALLSIPANGSRAALDLAPAALRDRTFRAIEAQVHALARSSPLLVVFEDAHWCDPTSRQLLERMVEGAAVGRALLVVTARPEFTPEWTRLRHATVLALNALARSATTALVAEIAGEHALPAPLVQQIVERAEGLPLYVEEITKATLESAAGPRGDQGHSIPATLRDSLMGRLDRLGGAKEVAQAAAVIGREFDDDLLEQILEIPTRARADALARLRQSQLVTERRAARPAHAFRHALIQEAAYQSLLTSTRRRYHQRIAEVLERRMADGGHGEPETIAHHFTEAGASDQAVVHWHRAGQRAAQRSANLEAIEHLQRALTLVRRQPAGRERAEHELTLLIALGPALMATRGWDAPEVREAYSLASRLAEETGRSADLFPAAWGRWLVAHASGEAALALDLLAQLFALLGDHPSPELLMQAHHAGASTRCMEADLDGTRAHLDVLIGLYRLDAHRDQALLYGGHDPSVCGHSMGALNELMRGDLPRSRALSDQALALAVVVGHEPSIAHAACYRAELCHIRREPGETEQQAERVLAIARDKGIAHYAAWALMLLGWAAVVRGDTDAGLGRLRDGLSALRTSGIRYHLPHRLAVRAEAVAAAGRLDEALDAIDEAIEEVAPTGEAWYEAEALRTKAGMLLARPHPDSHTARRCLEQALEVARSRHTMFWALRAAVDLAALDAREGRLGIARDMLATALAAFGADRSLPELREADALLARLRG